MLTFHSTQPLIKMALEVEVSKEYRIWSIKFHNKRFVKFSEFWLKTLLFFRLFFEFRFLALSLPLVQVQ